MTTGTEIPRHEKRHHHSSRHRHSHTNAKRPAWKLEPVYYFAGAVALVILARLLHVSLVACLPGVAGIVLLAISKHLRFRPGVILSIILALMMALIFNWQWADRYAGAFFSGEILAKRDLAKDSVFGTLFPAALTWIFHGQLNSIHVRSGQKWFEKKSSVVFFRLIWYVQLFLFLFNLVALGLHAIRPATSMGIADTNLLAGAVAVLAAGVPAILFILRGNQASGRRPHRPHRRHRTSPLPDTPPEK